MLDTDVSIGLRLNTPIHNSLFNEYRLVRIASVVDPSMDISNKCALKESERGQRRSGRGANTIQPDTASHQGVSNHLPASPLVFFGNQNKELCLFPVDCND